MVKMAFDLKDRIPNPGLAHEELVNALSTHDDLEVVCLGPLTNIALAEQSQPGSTSNAKMIYVMGGLVELPGNVTPLAEYNIWADPEAARLILESNINITMIGWDTTLSSAAMHQSDMDEIRALGTDLSKFAMDIQQVRLAWMRDTGEETSLLLADALAMAVVILPDSVTSSAHYMMKVQSGHVDNDKRGFIDCKLSSAKTGILHVARVDKSMYLKLMKESLMA